MNCNESAKISSPLIPWAVLKESLHVPNEPSCGSLESNKTGISACMDLIKRERKSSSSKVIFQQQLFLHEKPQMVLGSWGVAVQAKPVRMAGGRLAGGILGCISHRVLPHIHMRGSSQFVLCSSEGTGMEEYRSYTELGWNSLCLACSPDLCPCSVQDTVHTVQCTHSGHDVGTAVSPPLKPPCQPLPNLTEIQSPEGKDFE